MNNRANQYDHTDLRCLLADAAAAATGDSEIHHLPLEPGKHGMTFREGYRYTAIAGGYIGYPVDNKPQIIQKSDGPLLRCEDGTAHFLTLWERLGLKAGFLTLEQLNDKYRYQDTQGG